VGQEWLSAELRWVRPDSATGYCYRWRGGPQYWLHTARRRGTLVLTLNQDEGSSDNSSGTWRLAAPLGPVLRGTWVDPAGRRQPFVLRENYRCSVPYAIQTLTLTGGHPADSWCSPSLAQDYVHLLGPLRPAWQRVQAPPLAVRKRRMRATYSQEGDVSYSVSVRFNDFNLLSCQSFSTVFSAGGPRQDGLESTLFDLATGRPLTLASQLRPGYELLLRHLLSDELQRDLHRQYSYLKPREGDEINRWSTTIICSADCP
jgi:hypothetical protein